MTTGRKNLMRWKPYGPIAAQESDEEFDLPAHAARILLVSWRQSCYEDLPSHFKEHEQGSAATRALRGPPNEAPSGAFFV